MALSDSYSDFAQEFKDETNSYLNNEIWGYSEETKKTAKLIYSLLKNEGGFIDIGPNNIERKNELIIEQNEILESLKRKI